MKEFRTLRADEIELRVGQYNKDKSRATLLLYKTARTDMAYLDELVGTENWQCRYYECKGNLYCSIGIRTDGEWIWKDNCGSESNIEKEKGEASDAMKRAGFCWGIGRELYTAPTIWVRVPEKGIYPDTFTVMGIGYDENRCIVDLLIVDKDGNEVFKMGNGVPKVQKPLKVISRERTPNAWKSAVNKVKDGMSRFDLCDLLNAQGYRDVTDDQWESLVLEASFKGMNEAATGLMNLTVDA